MSPRVQARALAAVVGSWLQEKAPSNRASVDASAAEVDRGEAEAIALTAEGLGRAGVVAQGHAAVIGPPTHHNSPSASRRDTAP